MATITASIMPKFVGIMAPLPHHSLKRLAHALSCHTVTLFFAEHVGLHFLLLMAFHLTTILRERFWRRAWRLRIRFFLYYFATWQVQCKSAAAMASHVEKKCCRRDCHCGNTLFLLSGCKYLKYWTVSGELANYFESIWWLYGKPHSQTRPSPFSHLPGEGLQWSLNFNMTSRFLLPSPGIPSFSPSFLEQYASWEALLGLSPGPNTMSSCHIDCQKKYILQIECQIMPKRTSEQMSHRIPERMSE